MPIINKGKHKKYWIKENRNAFFYPDEWIKLFDLANENQKRSLNMMINTGARIDEIRNVKVEDIHFDRNWIELKKTKVRSKLKETKPTSRPIPISSQFSRDLKKYITKFKLQQIDTIPMIKTQGMAYTIKSLAKKIRREDYKNFSSHNIRKTFETWMFALGVDPFKVAQHLGHDLKTAMKHYVSPDIFDGRDKEKMIKILGDLVQRMRGGM